MRLQAFLHGVTGPMSQAADPRTASESLVCLASVSAQLDGRSAALTRCPAKLDSEGDTPPSLCHPCAPPLSDHVTMALPDLRQGRTCSQTTERHSVRAAPPCQGRGLQSTQGYHHALWDNTHTHRRQGVARRGARAQSTPAHSHSETQGQRRPQRHRIQETRRPRGRESERPRDTDP